jgi:soluble lytic murein transglycosylase-like protein
MAVVVSFAWPCSAKADVYKFVGKSGTPYYTARPSSGRASGIPPRPRDANFTWASTNLGYKEYSGQYSAAPLSVNQWVDLAAQTYNLDPKLLHAVIGVESSYDAAAVSPKGAVGLMQLMPATAARFNVADPLDARENILGGSRYLRTLLALFDQDLELALAAYNAGEQNVIRYGRRVPPFIETQAYVDKVLGRYLR